MAFFRPSHFKGVTPDREIRDNNLALPPPERHLGILFTPRSGSSWLTDVLEQAKSFGKPREWFNPDFLAETATSVGCDTLDDYIHAIQRGHNTRGCFSFEATLFQLQAIFEDPDRLLSYIPADTVWVYLTRQDIVLQAVSLAKAVATNVYHSADQTATTLQNADRQFTYDANAIAYWLEHVFQLEQETESFIARNGIVPRRLNYESLTAAGAGAAVQTFSELLGITGAVAPETSTHVKIGTDRNAHFADRFRAENAYFVARIEARRTG